MNTLDDDAVDPFDPLGAATLPDSWDQVSGAGGDPTPQDPADGSEPSPQPGIPGLSDAATAGAAQGGFPSTDLFFRSGGYPQPEYDIAGLQIQPNLISHPIDPGEFGLLPEDYRRYGEDQVRSREAPPHQDAYAEQADPNARQVLGDAAIYVGQQLNKSGMARDPYIQTVRGLDRFDGSGRTDAKILAREATPPFVRNLLEEIRPGTSSKSGSTGSANVTNASADALAKAFKYGGRAMIGAALAGDVYDIATSPQPKQATAQAALGLIGGYGGGTFGTIGGAALGSLLGSPGIGTIAGGLAGGVAGSEGGRRLGNYLYTHLSVAPEVK